VIRDLVLFGLGFVFAYALDHWLFERHMRKLPDRIERRRRQLEEL